MHRGNDRAERRVVLVQLASGRAARGENSRGLEKVPQFLVPRMRTAVVNEDGLGEVFVNHLDAQPLLFVKSLPVVVNARAGEVDRVLLRRPEPQLTCGLEHLLVVLLEKLARLLN